MASDAEDLISPTGDGDQTPVGTKRKRAPRVAVACDTCRTRKVKCDGGCPCTNCVHHRFSCSYKEREQVIRVAPGGNDAQSTPSFSGPRLTPRTDESRYRQPAGLPPTSPVSLGGAPEAEPFITPAAKYVGSGSADPGAAEKQYLGTLGRINQHTEGTEFYGPNGTFYFLSKLRSQAKSHGQQITPQLTGQDTAETYPTESTVVSLLHSSDYSFTDSPRDRTRHAGDRASRRSHSGSRDVSDTRSRRGQSPVDSEIERECVRLYFQNQHCIHPVLDQASFISRCEDEAWAETLPSKGAPSPQMRSHTRFMALLNSVLAIGAINAGETSTLTGNRALEFLDLAEKLDYQGTPYLPIRVARLFFERAKSHLGDVFESTCLETAQTLFLMSVFCQDALKPHACYMYSGMAVRTASAMGIPMSQYSSDQERLLWWGLYSHEIEMCSSSGRQSFLKPPRSYQIPRPRGSASRGPSLYMVSCMVELAEILAVISQNAAQSDSTDKMSRETVRLENELAKWKSRLPHHLDFDASSLDESELVTKQKIVLKLRFLNAQILLHRPFLITRAELDQKTASQHDLSVIEAAMETIAFMHTTYMHRPYFRTWWYNCTYVLDASMVLLYAIVSNICPLPAESIFSSVERSLEILRVMKMVAVARRCAEITQDVLNVAKRLQASRHGQRAAKTGHSDELAPSDRVNESTAGGTFAGERSGNASMDLFQEDTYATLVDSNFLSNLLNFEDWNAWSEAGFE